MSKLDVALSIALGLGLAAAVGFRVFVPLLVASVAAYTEHLQLSSGFAWLGSLSAVTMLSVAAIAEVLAYYIPVVDNLLDTIATPVALVAGTLVSAAVMVDLPPLVKWTAAVIAGGGAAGLTQVAELRAACQVHCHDRRPRQFNHRQWGVGWGRAAFSACIVCAIGGARRCRGDFLAGSTHPAQSQQTYLRRTSSFRSDICVARAY